MVKTHGKEGREEYRILNGISIPFYNSFCISFMYLTNNKHLYIPPLAPRDLLDSPEREVRYFSKSF